MSKKVYIKTYGCQMNEYDTEKMLSVLKQSHGFESTQNPDEADLLLLNTCSIREKAQEKVFSELGRWKHHKQRNGHRVIGVGGCVASQEGKAIVERSKIVDLVFGPQTIHRLPALYEQCLSTQKPAIDISFPEIEKFDALPKPEAKGPTAHVSIMEGCSKYCSYCVVPYTRGEEISRPFDDVLTEVAELTEQGVLEINLLGQNVNDYQGEIFDSTEKADLALLIQYISALEPIKRIRFTTSHPLAFSDNLIRAYKEIPKLANQLHLPVQSGSDKILTLMKRGYTALEFKSKIKKLRQVRPDISLSSDFIVGFPGETDDDFEKTMAVIEDIQFDSGFSFIFSARPGTPAANLADDTPLETKKKRLAHLQERIKHFDQCYKEKLANTIQTVLVTGPAKRGEGQLTGRTECNRVVHFKGNERLIGHLIPVKILSVAPNCLMGEVSH